MTEFVRKERLTKVIYPSCDNVYAWSRACEADEIKVVILGQDPYHGPNQAHGLCFSVLAGVSVPPSLENIFKELMVDIPEFRHPGHGYLVGWAKQGVLLLNACLTVEGGKANSHQGKAYFLVNVGLGVANRCSHQLAQFQFTKFSFYALGCICSEKG